MGRASLADCKRLAGCVLHNPLAEPVGDGLCGIRQRRAEGIAEPLGGGLCGIRQERRVEAIAEGLTHGESPHDLSPFILRVQRPTECGHRLHLERAGTTVNALVACEGTGVRTKTVFIYTN